MREWPACASARTMQETKARSSALQVRCPVYAVLWDGSTTHTCKKKPTREDAEERAFTWIGCRQTCGPDQDNFCLAQKLNLGQLRELIARAPREDAAATGLALDVALDALRAPEGAIVKEGSASGTRLQRTRQQVRNYAVVYCVGCGSNGWHG
jgi:hypothetical protein